VIHDEWLEMSDGDAKEVISNYKALTLAEQLYTEDKKLSAHWRHVLEIVTDQKAFGLLCGMKEAKRCAGSLYLY